MPELLPRFHAFQEKVESERKIAKAILEAGEDEPQTAKPLTRSADGHDPARLRGLPAIGRNVAGAMRGTDPLGALIRKESQRR